MSGSLFYFEVISFTNEAQRYDLSEGESVLGRQADCEIVLPASTVSRRHARVTKTGLEVFLEDLGSQNGTLRDGLPISGKVRLNPGDEFQIDQYVIRLHRREMTDTTPEFRGEPTRVVVPGESRETFRRLAQQQPVFAEFDVDTSAVAQAGHHAEQKLQAILELVSSAGSVLEIEQVLSNLLVALLRIFPLADRVAVFLRESEGPLVFKGARIRASLPPHIECSRWSQTVHERVMRDAKVLLSQNVADDERFEGSQSLAGLTFHSVLCAPLLGPSHRPLGVIQLDRSQQQGVFEASDAEILASIATLTGLFVESASWHRSQLELLRRQQDLQVAKSVQQQFLPQVEPSIPGYIFAYHYEPAELVGGDCFDVIPLSPNRWAITIGDVAGKGIPAALFMARLSGKVRTFLRHVASVRDTMNFLNERVAATVTTGRFVTFALGILDLNDHTLTLACAGHIPPFHRSGSDGSVRQVAMDQVAGPPLGLAEHWSYAELVVQIQPGDSILFVTDGITEAQNSTLDLFGDSPLKLCGAGARDAQDWVVRLLANVRQHAARGPRLDDICVVGFTRAR